MEVNSLLREKKELDPGGEVPSSNKRSLTPILLGGSRHTTTKQDVVRCSLDQLPIGILHKIVDHLDLVALACLKGSNRHFYNIISIDPSLLSVCMRWRIHVQFWRDKTTRPLEKVCVLCNIKGKHRRFRDGDVRLVMEGPAISCSKSHINKHKPIIDGKTSHRYSTTDRWKTDRWKWDLIDYRRTLLYNIPEPPQSLIESHVNYTLDHMYYATHGHPRRLDPKNLYRWDDKAGGQCYDHLMDQFGSSKSVEALLPLIHLPVKPAWLRFTMILCTHCGRHVDEGDSRLHGCLKCCCDVCHRQLDQKFYRAGPRRTPNPQIRRILAYEKGYVWIYEVGSKYLAENMP